MRDGETSKKVNVTFKGDDVSRHSPLSITQKAFPSGSSSII